MAVIILAMICEYTKYEGSCNMHLTTMFQLFRIAIINDGLSACVLCVFFFLIEQWILWCNIFALPEA